jgi:hypothetical protein
LGLSWSWLYRNWIYNYLCNQCLSPLMLWVLIPFRRGVFDTTLCDKVCQWLEAGCWFSPGSPVSSTYKTDCHDIAEILLKVLKAALNIISHVFILTVVILFRVRIPLVFRNHFWCIVIFIAFQFKYMYLFLFHNCWKVPIWTKNLDIKSSVALFAKICKCIHKIFTDNYCTIFLQSFSQRLLLEKF